MAKLRSKIKKAINDVLESRKVVTDTGNGSNGGLTNLGSTDVKTVTTGVARMDVTELHTGKGSDHIDIPLTYKWKGLTYLAGDDIDFGNPDRIEEGYGADRYGTDHHAFNIAVTLSELLQVPSNQPIVLGVPVPPAILAEDKTIPQKIRNRIGDKLEITVNERGQEIAHYVFNIEKVVILEELKSVRNLITHDNCGNELNWREKLGGRYVLLDIGAFTLNVQVLNNGRFEPLPLHVQSMRDLGLRALHADIIKRQGLQGVRNSDVDKALRNGGKVNTLNHGIITLDKDIVNDATDAHLIRMTSALNTAGVTAKSVHGSLIVGGGMEIFDSAFNDIYGVVNDEMFHEAHVPYGLLTAYGMYRQLVRKY